MHSKQLKEHMQCVPQQEPALRRFITDILRTSDMTWQVSRKIYLSSGSEEGICGRREQKYSSILPLSEEQMNDSGHIHSSATPTSGTGIRYPLSKRLVERHSSYERLKKETRLVPARKWTANPHMHNPRFFTTLTELPVSVWYDSNIK
jgi:hypothetical protein